MQDIGKFVAWVKSKGGQRGLAAAFSKKFPKERPISQTAISNWVTRRSIPVERWAQLEVLGWHGPWEWPREEAEVSEPAPAYVTAVLPEHVQEAYDILLAAVDASGTDFKKLDRRRTGLVVGLIAEEVAKGSQAETRQTLIRRAEVLLGLKG